MNLRTRIKCLAYLIGDRIHTGLLGFFHYREELKESSTETVGVWRAISEGYYPICWYVPEKNEYICYAVLHEEMLEEANIKDFWLQFSGAKN